MRKYGDAQPTEVFRGKEAAVVNQYMKKFGKPVGDFTDDERALFEQDLALVRPDEIVEEKPVKKTTRKAKNVGAE